MTVEATSRIQVLTSPLVAPGKCIVCGAVDSEQGRTYIDFGFSIKFYGVVYFCSFCLVEIAEAVNFVKNEKYLALLEKYEELKKALETSKERVRALNDFVRTSLDIDSPDDTLWDISDPTEVHDNAEGNSSVSDIPIEDNDESSNSEGHAGIRGTSESNSRSPNPARKSDVFEF